MLDENGTNWCLLQTNSLLVRSANDSYATFTHMTDDILFVMAGLGFIGFKDGKYHANEVTEHLVQFPSSIHGALHLWVNSDKTLLSLY